MSDALSFHEKFTNEQFDANYNLRLSRPDLVDKVIPDWIHRSEAARLQLNGQLDIRYGEGEKQRLDVFSCGDETAPTLVYFHGGYWQTGDKSIYAFLAKPFVDNGANVVVVGYDLCPAVTITDISREAREAMAYLWRNASDLQLNQNRLVVMGHSAGGHMTLMMMGTHWPSFGSDLPQELIAGGIPISPLSYLEPVRRTQVLNDVLCMTREEAARESPLLNHAPTTNVRQIVAIGGKETDEFHRQAQIYVDAFNTRNRSVEMLVVPDVDHFDVLNVLVDSNSRFFDKAQALMNSTR